MHRELSATVILFNRRQHLAQKSGFLSMSPFCNQLLIRFNTELAHRCDRSYKVPSNSLAQKYAGMLRKTEKNADVSRKKIVDLQDFLLDDQEELQLDDLQPEDQQIDQTGDDQLVLYLSVAIGLIGVH